MPERIQRPPLPWGPKQGDGDGPRSPDISRPIPGTSEKRCARSIPTSQALSPARRVSDGTERLGLDRFLWRERGLPRVCSPPRDFWRRHRCRWQPSAANRTGVPRRLRRFWPSSSTAASSSPEIAGRRRAIPSSTIARTKFSKSIGTRSWRSREWRRRPWEMARVLDIPSVVPAERKLQEMSVDEKCARSQNCLRDILDSFCKAPASSFDLRHLRSGADRPRGCILRRDGRAFEVADYAATGSGPRPCAASYYENNWGKKPLASSAKTRP